MEADDEVHAPTFDESARDPDPANDNNVLRRLADAGELIAAIPAMLGFFPHRSLVVALLGPHPSKDGVQAIGAVSRFDIDSATDPAETPGLTRVLKSICLSQNASSTLMIVVDDRPTGSTTARNLLRHLAQAGIEPSHAWWVKRIAAGTRYRDLLRPGHDGRVDDPRASTVAFAQVLDGHQISASRDELTDLLAPSLVLADQVRSHLASAVARYRDDLTAAYTPNRMREQQRNRIMWVLYQISTAEELPSSAQDLATTVALLRDRTIRDIMYGLARSEGRGAAEALWREIASATDGYDRAEAATLFGYSAYFHGNTVVAGIAIATALDADPSHTMAALLEIALGERLPADQIRVLAEVGVSVAAELGIDIT
ncbi:DUF4192 domain-containing protein [Nocardia fluminea]|uniref:Uncharacterized protein DUF4192 n=1 Tax=Nocardia fluminea TaxID=134984 RepID=A0A2N3VHH8_9NOCA|nr:DUF4192 domain-containing protein [Nocardia fluminea]PKV81072.1 uncharacterized protein DUF4192 [Nocardia fluminea]